MKTVVLDTNVLLSDPKVILSFPDAEVVVPEVVLGELDKIKVSRTDADVRFRGREVSRIIFELSENGSLTDGVELPDGGTFRIIPFTNASLPDGMGTKTTDDKILAAAWQLAQVKGLKDEVVLVTNDLNMLLKAQTLGINFEQWEDGMDGGWSKRYVIRPFQRYKVPLTILALSLAVFAGVFFYARSWGSSTSLPTEYKTILSDSQVDAIDALRGLQRNPDDPTLLLKLADFYYDQYNATVHSSPAQAMAAAKQGVDYYTRYLKQKPGDVAALVDLSTLQFYNGQTDDAIQNVGKALQAEPNHLEANFNLGIFYLQGRRDYDKALAQFNRVLDLTKGDATQTQVNQAAQEMIDQIKAEQDQIKAQEENPGGAQ